MYQNLSKNAKAVMNLAQTIAHKEEEEYIGTEHILLAMLEYGQGTAVQVLRACNISPESVKSQLAQLRKDSMENTWVLGRLPGTPHVKQVITFALEEAEKLQADKVGTECLLQGILREKGCLAESALQSLGLSLNMVREKIS